MLSLIIPACDEELRIRETIRDLQTLKDTELIVVCNGCTDRTPDIARLLGAKVMELKERNKGHAVLAGIDAAKSNPDSDIVGFIDADGAFNSNTVRMLVREMADSDMIIASKWKGRSFSSAYGSTGRKIASRMWNWLARHLLGLDFYDTQAGLKLMRREILGKIGTDFLCTGFAFDAELLYRVKKAGGNIKEVYAPVQEIKNKGTSFSIVRTPGMLRSLLKLWLREKLKKKFKRSKGRE